ncbi:MAG: hypothetical protein GWO87_03365 [Xanthomonadaceae bacterium]|nr:hypothetical protein [Rhodospirillaceae bacterium]NIA18200.1 hypothetical protein [Xanthomonadaceae bacterium]
MINFKMNKNIAIACESKSSRSGFNHFAYLLIDKEERDKAKIHYINRTWEEYDFQSVIEKLINKTFLLTPRQKVIFPKIAKKIANGEIKQQFKTIGTITKMGEIFHANNQKAQNDWKARILKAGLEKKGLIMPDDWEELSEDTKQTRLDAVIKQLAD